MTSCSHSETRPSDWLTRFAPMIRPYGTVLDVAAGSGRNSLWLAAQGWRVEAVDRDEAALALLQGIQGIHTQIADLENGPWPYPGQTFDGIVVCRYLHRPLFPVLADSLSPGGILIYETFMLGHEAYGRPKNPDFLLRPNELLEMFMPALTPVAFEQGLDEIHQSVVQRICLLNGPAIPIPA
ncbi:MAG TPA: methyltransferase domain-containing protein [Methylophilaceae bacterium]|nr:methyltransferase domain-containing protein [Methylophilaceae bacterium]